MLHRNIEKGLLRVLMPSLIVTLYYIFRHDSKVSLRAEVDLSRNLRLGKGCVVNSFVKIKVSNGPMIMGDRGSVASGSYISAGAGAIKIGDNFMCGPNVNITGQNYNYGKKNVHFEDQGIASKGIVIGNNVWIGAGSTVTDGAVIGDNTIIVANSLINRRYKGDVILQGTPAKVIMNR